MPYDVVIAGAGPAGVAAAMATVRADPSLHAKVLLLDRARFPRAKPCGGGLTGHVDEAMAALGLELAVPHLPSPRATVRYGGFTREVALPRAVKVVRREEFDASLVAQARDAGVEVREDAALLGFTVEQGGVTVATREGTIRARVLVGAEGVGSLVRKHLARLRGRAPGRSRRSAEGGGARSDDPVASGPPEPPPIRLFRAEIPARGRAGDAMIYDFTPMRDGLRGYLWVFPVPGDRLNVGLMHAPSRPLSGGELAALLRARLADHGLALDGAALRGWPAWGYVPSREVAAPHLLTVGDAAGIDALTGEGIAVGLEQGLVAGRHIADGLGRGDLRFRGYRRALRRAVVGRELALDRWLAWMLYGGARWRYWLPLLLCDEEVLDLYAARVSGTLVLAERKHALVMALARHLGQAGARRRMLDAAARGGSELPPAPRAPAAPGGGRDAAAAAEAGRRSEPAALPGDPS